jgi:hypothetical protein
MLSYLCSDSTHNIPQPIGQKCNIPPVDEDKPEVELTERKKNLRSGRIYNDTGLVKLLEGAFTLATLDVGYLDCKFDHLV